MSIFVCWDKTTFAIQLNNNSTGISVRSNLTAQRPHTELARVKRKQQQQNKN
jgi:hypothetical protein